MFLVEKVGRFDKRAGERSGGNSSRFLRQNGEFPDSEDLLVLARMLSKPVDRLDPAISMGHTLIKRLHRMETQRRGCNPNEYHCEGDLYRRSRKGQRAECYG